MHQRQELGLAQLLPQPHAARSHQLLLVYLVVLVVLPKQLVQARQQPALPQLQQQRQQLPAEAPARQLSGDRSRLLQPPTHRSRSSSCGRRWHHI